MKFTFTSDPDCPIEAAGFPEFIDIWRQRTHGGDKGSTEDFCRRQAAVIETWCEPCIAGRIRLNPTTPESFVDSLVEAGALVRE